MKAIEKTEFFSIHACDWMNLELMAVSVNDIVDDEYDDDR